MDVWELRIGNIDLRVDRMEEVFFEFLDWLLCFLIVFMVFRIFLIILFL